MRLCSTCESNRAAFLEWTPCKKCASKIEKEYPPIILIQNCRRTLHKLEDAYESLLELQAECWVDEDWKTINDATSAISKIKDAETSRLYLEETALLQDQSK